MKTFITAASFALTIGLSSVAHAGFNDQGPMIDTVPARAAQQGLSQTPVVHGFNQQSHYAAASNSASRSSRDPMALGANCDLNPRFGFQNSSSGASC